jgi:hypothetical protein
VPQVMYDITERNFSISSSVSDDHFERVHALSQPNIYSVNRMHNLLMLNFVFYFYVFDWCTITNRTNEKKDEPTIC